MARWAEFVHDGRLWAFLLAQSPKCGDLQRDPRYALHAMPGEEVDDEFMVRGRGRRVDVDDQLHRAIVDAAKPASVGADTELLFELELDRAMTATYTHRGQWPPAYATWRASDA